MKQARIYKPTKTAMQSGQARTSKWKLEILEDSGTKFVEPIMGWVGNSDMYSKEFRMYFDSKEDACSYAQAHNLEYEVVEPKEFTPKIKSYSKNFQ